MSEFDETGKPTPTQVGSNPYNSYGLATQGFVWAAISSVSGTFDGKVNSVNGIGPDSDRNVNVSSIFFEDYSGDRSEIRADLTALSGGEELRILTNIDYSTLDSKIDSVSGDSSDKFSVIAAASGGWNNAQTEIESSSADWHNVETKVETTSAKWDSVYFSVKSTSGGWDAATLETESHSGNWNSVYSTVNGTSAEWVKYNYLESNYLPLSGGELDIENSKNDIIGFHKDGNSSYVEIAKKTLNADDEYVVSDYTRIGKNGLERRGMGEIQFPSSSGTIALSSSYLSGYGITDVYTKKETEHAINSLAAYYITYDAEGNAFPHTSSLMYAETVYSGGVARIPTRNDYAVVLEDEDNDYDEWRYIYSVAPGESTGHWEAQYPIETNDYTALSDKPQINGNELIGNKTGRNLGLRDYSDLSVNDGSDSIALTSDMNLRLLSESIYPEWIDDGREYPKDSVVTHCGKIWRSLSNTRLEPSSENPTKWESITFEGISGRFVKIDEKGSVVVGSGNTSISERNVVVGYDNTAGLKGYRWSDITFGDNPYITLNRQTNGLTQQSISLSKDDVISVINDSKYDNCATIKSISWTNDSVLIYTSKLPFNSIVSDSDWDSKMLFAYSKPYAGHFDLGMFATSEGLSTSALNLVAHSEGFNTLAYGQYSHAEGRDTEAGYAAHAEGHNTHAIGERSHSEGGDTISDGNGAHSEGMHTASTGIASHAEGYSNTRVDYASFSSLSSLTAYWDSLGDEEKFTLASSTGSHAEGHNTLSLGLDTHSEGFKTIVVGNHAHVEGSGSKSLSGVGAHAEGVRTETWGDAAHAEGYETRAHFNYAHSEGQATYATNRAAHAEGVGRNDRGASGIASHVEGVRTTASKQAAHAEGQETTASGTYAHSEGFWTIAQNQSEHAQGQYNKSNNGGNNFGNEKNTLHSIGFGQNANDRKNAIEVMQDGKTFVYGVGGYDGKNPTGQPNVATDLATVISEKIEKIDLPYALVEPGKWEFSDGGTYTMDGPQEAMPGEPDTTYYWTLYQGSTRLDDSISYDSSSVMSMSVLFPTVQVFATRASLPGHLLDRAVNAVVVAGTTVITLPSLVTGKSRDFYLKMSVTGSQQVSFSPSTGIAYTGFGDPSKTYSEGTYLLRFTETSENEFCISYMDVNLSLIDVRDTIDSLGRQDKRVAIGKNADASGLAPNGQNNNYQAVAVGNNAKAKAPASVALGPWARTGGDTPSSFGVAIGYRSYAPAQASVAIGSGVSSEKTENAYTDEDGNPQEAYAIASAKGAVQIGPGENLTQDSLKFRGTVLVDSTGKIPAASMDGTVVVSPSQYDGNRISIGTGSLVPDVVPSTDTHGNSMGGATVVGKPITSVVALGNGSKVGRSSTVAIGPGAKSYGGNSVAIGYNAEAYAQANNSVALGPSAVVGYNAKNSVQLGPGTCTDEWTLQFRSTKLAQGTNANDIKILHDVLPDNIATKDDLPYELVVPGEWEFSGSGVQPDTEYSVVEVAGVEYEYTLKANGVTISVYNDFSSTDSNPVDFSSKSFAMPPVDIVARRTGPHLLDRAVNAVSITSSENLVFPEGISGKSRDFYLNMTVSGTQTVTFSGYEGENITWYGTIPPSSFDEGSVLYRFTEVSHGRFVYQELPVSVSLSSITDGVNTIDAERNVWRTTNNGATTKIGTLALTSDIPPATTVVPPLTSSLEGQAADAKATGTALYTGFTEWECTPSELYGKKLHVVHGDGEWSLYADNQFLDPPEAADDYVTSLTFSVYNVTATRHLVTPTKTSQLDNDGDGSSEFPFATTGQVAAKQDALTAQQLENIAAVPNKADKSEVEPLLLKQWYPDGSVTSTSQFTQGLKYEFDTVNNTASVKPFCDTGDSSNNNSDIVGDVVIPPYVESNGVKYVVSSVLGVNTVGVSNARLTSIKSPTTVKSVGKGAFNDCIFLSSVSLPSATSVGNNAFNVCASLSSVSLPSATSIGAGAFYSCTSLASVSLPSATSIGAGAFMSCTSLSSVSLPSATSVGEDAFRSCTSLSSASLPSATSVGNNAFLSCTSLSSVSLPSATSVGKNAFRSCTSLALIDFGKDTRSSVPSLGNNAFSGVTTSQLTFVVPDSNYNAWIAASGWADLYNGGAKFYKYSEWEAPHRYELNTKADLSDLPYALVTPGVAYELSAATSPITYYDGEAYVAVDTVVEPIESGGDVTGYMLKVEGGSDVAEYTVDGTFVQWWSSGWFVGDGESILPQIVLTGHLLDRAVNAVSVTDATTLTLPTLSTGKSSDFYLKMTVTGSQQVTFSPSTGITYTGFGNPAKTYSAGTYVLHFTETSENEFCVTDMLAQIPDVTGKADKVSGATAGNLASLTETGNLADSGVKPSDFAAKADLPYRLVEPGKWAFSDGVAHVLSGPYESSSETWYYGLDESDGVFASMSEDFDTESDALAALSVVFYGQFDITATRPSLPGHLCDRANNLVDVSSDTTLTLPAIISGKSRDLMVRMNVTGGTHQVSFSTQSPEPSATWLGGNPPASFGLGVHYISISESAPGEFVFIDGMLDEPESAANKVDFLSVLSTDVQYPSAKCVYDFVISRTDDKSDVFTFTDLQTISSQGSEQSPNSVTLEDAKTKMVSVSAASAYVSISAPTGVSSHVRDMMLTFDCSTLSSGEEPYVTWGLPMDVFESGAASGIAPKSGQTNLYRITEYKSGHYLVRTMNNEALDGLEQALELINGNVGQESSLGQVIVDLQEDISDRQRECVFQTLPPPLSNNEIVLADATNTIHTPNAPVSGETYTREAFTVRPPTGTSDHARDMMLSVNCSGLDATQTPLISWDNAFHPRSDESTDMVPVPGELCVFYVSEYYPSRYVVSMWVETDGGYFAFGGSGS